MTWCENAGTCSEGMSSASSCLHVGPPVAVAQVSLSLLYKVYISSMSKAVVGLSCSAALQGCCHVIDVATYPPDLGPLVGEPVNPDLPCSSALPLETDTVNS